MASQKTIKALTFCLRNTINCLGRQSSKTMPMVSLWVIDIIDRRPDFEGFKEDVETLTKANRLQFLRSPYFRYKTFDYEAVLDAIELDDDIRQLAKDYCKYILDFKARELISRKAKG